MSVVICAYTMDRWSLLQAAVDSVHSQSHPPVQLIISIDHNPELLLRASEEWNGQTIGETSVLVVENQFEGRLGGARTTAARRATGDIVAFLDDDAAASANWLETLVRVYDEVPQAMVVGGAPRPDFAVPPPGWFPHQFYWVFGCHYEGLPDSRQAVRRVIGANMSARRSVLEELGGFHSDNHDDMDLCHRAHHLHGEEAVWYEPAAVVHHYVGSDRVKWAYFWRRCFYVNRGKVAAMAGMGDAGDHGADVSFATQMLSSAGKDAIRLALKGNFNGLRQVVVCVLGLGFAAVGNAVGRIQLATGRSSITDPLRLSPQTPTEPQTPETPETLTGVTESSQA